MHSRINPLLDIHNLLPKLTPITLQSYSNIYILQKSCNQAVQRATITKKEDIACIFFIIGSWRHLAAKRAASSTLVCAGHPSELF